MPAMVLLLRSLTADAPPTWRPSCASAALLAVALLVTVTAAPTAGTAPGPHGPEPYVLLWPDTHQSPRPVERRTEVGLVYAPDVLATLVARRSQDAVAPRILEAIRERTPIVVMWEFPTAPAEPQAQRPYRVRIAERAQEEASALAPLWIQQDAAGLQELDSRLSTEIVRPGSGVGVGAMAAFPREAFVPGRLVHLESQRTRSEHGLWSRHRRYGAIEPPLVQALAR
jgi:hypothetical protein